MSSDTIHDDVLPTSSAAPVLAPAPKPGVLALFATASRLALQWRLLLLWLLAMALPLLLLSLPLLIALKGGVESSLLASKLLDPLDLPVLVELLSGLSQRGYSPAAALPALIVLALLLPWLSGLVIAAARSPVRLGFGELLRGGLVVYGRMARLWLWALLPLGIAAGVTAGLLHYSQEQALKDVLESDAERRTQIMLAVGGVLFALALASVDAARALLALEPQRRSVVLAWWRASKDLLRQPRRIVLYLLFTALGLLLAALLGVLRLQVQPVGAGSLLLALLLGQALVLALSWMRCARLFALVEAAR